jgi:uncharacterized protein with HEPN domain
MSKRDAGLLLADIREAMAKIARYVAGMSQESFFADEKTIDAVARNVGMIGEAANQVPADFKARPPAVLWKQMAGMRNRIVHDYAGVDLAIVSEVATKSLRQLDRAIAGLEEILRIRIAF